MIGEFARKSISKHSMFPQLQQKKRHTCYVSNFTVLFESHRGSNVLNLSRELRMKSDTWRFVEKVLLRYTKQSVSNMENFVLWTAFLRVSSTENQKLFKIMGKFDA